MVIPQFQEIRTVLRQSPELVLCCHFDPDGDALGSLLGLGLALRNKGWQVQLVSPDGIPSMYNFLPGAEDVSTTITAFSNRAVAIVLDCGDLERLGPLASEVATAKQIINIDHHPTNTEFGTINWVEPRAAATAEMVFSLLWELSIPVDLDIATCLYTGIHTDTGGFRYQNTTADVHKVAETLLRIGVKPWEIADKVYDRKSLSQLRLLQQALERLQVSSSGLIAWVSLPYDRFGCYTDEDIGGLINYPRMVASAEVAVLLRENDDRQVRVGFRSRHLVDVGLLAKRLGGGGHSRAAGCILSGSLTQVETQVLAAVEKELQEARNHA
ncbi:MAG TPA: bifunctional oligoribonuclease/PAP phosphatase NrnA [Firmicutes bacterium]|nr:bifunctional oligoribonuclease/PAP phosphatase NrnA [Bacillota bacterium]